MHSVLCAGPIITEGADTNTLDSIQSADTNTRRFKVPYTLEAYAALETAALVFNGVPSHLNSRSMHRGTSE